MSNQIAWKIVPQEKRNSLTTTGHSGGEKHAFAALVRHGTHGDAEVFQRGDVLTCTPSKPTPARGKCERRRAPAISHRPTRPKRSYLRFRRALVLHPGYDESP